MHAEWLVFFTSRRQLAAFFSNLLFLAVIVLADGWVLIQVARPLGIYAALALHGSVAIFAIIILGNSINHRIKDIRSDARSGFFRPHRYARLAAVVIATVLLILPGFVSDGIGLLIYYPPGRIIFSWLFLRRYRESLFEVYEYLTLAVFSDDDELPAGVQAEQREPPFETE